MICGKLTERSCAVNPVHSNEEVFTESNGLEHVATFPHDLLLFLNVFYPLPLADVGTRPQRNLVVLASQMHECDGEPALRVLDWDDGCMWRVLDESLLTSIHRLLDRVVVGSRDEEKLQWYGLTELSAHRPPRRTTDTYPAVDLILLDLALRFDHQECVVKQEDHKLATVSLRVTPLLESALVDELSTFFLQPEVLHQTVSEGV